MNHYRFEDLKIGDVGGFSISITSRMMCDFLSISGDINPLHNDNNYAVNLGFKDKVSFGMLTASFLSTLVGVYIPGEKSIIQDVNISFVRPVYVGDRLDIKGEIVEKNNAVKRVVLKVDIRNQDNIRVLKGKINVGMHE